MTGDEDLRDAVVIERVFDAPVDLVWRMWTDPDLFRAWYGPTGASVPLAMMDVRIGGARRICMEVRTPHGSMQMWFTGEFRDVVPPMRLVYTEALTDEDGNVIPPSQLGMPDDQPETTEVIVELEDIGGRTRMVMTHRGIPRDSAGAAGWAMALDKLAVHVGEQRP